ncbi:MAG: 50S ribosomal protein L15 [Phycisphaerae bacterium]|nr:50S ribosomal protein L15 [Phycisphaerae bacterium]
MMIHEITEKVGKYKARKRVGRGRGSGVGKTSGRGHKGAGSRSGYSRRPGFEGGQMQYFRRIPKRGFSNADFKTVYSIVNVASLQERFTKGDAVDVAALVEKGLVRNFKNPIKILGQGELSIALTITADKVSTSAQKKIEDAGGTVTIIEKKKWVRADRKVKKAAAPAEAATEAPEETPEVVQEEAPEVQEAPQEESAPETPEAEASNDSEGDE